MPKKSTTTSASTRALPATNGIGPMADSEAMQWDGTRESADAVSRWVNSFVPIGQAFPNLDFVIGPGGTAYDMRILTRAAGCHADGGVDPGGYIVRHGSWLVLRPDEFHQRFRITEPFGEVWAIATKPCRVESEAERIA